jgi:hypothetical protein
MIVIIIYDYSKVYEHLKGGKTCIDKNYSDFNKTLTFLKRPVL